MLLALLLAFSGISLHAQHVQVNDLTNSLGSWEGKLTYLDYSSGNPFTLLANIEISLTKDKNGYIMAYAYPKEPQANSKDTLYVKGKLFGEETVIKFKKDAVGGFSLVTEKDGIDGNDNKKAILRHTYLLHSTTYSIVKEVKFEGTNTWIKRNEYLLNRISH
jgi:hypothetical protein